MKKTSAAEILKSEYNITTIKELDLAIKKLGYIDISLFCTTDNKLGGIL